MSILKNKTTFLLSIILFVSPIRSISQQLEIEVHKTLLGHTDIISSLIFSPDGKIMVTGSLDKSIILWSIDTGKLIKTFSGNFEEIRCLAFSPNGKILASANKTIKFL